MNSTSESSILEMWSCSPSLLVLQALGGEAVRDHTGSFNDISKSLRALATDKGQNDQTDRCNSVRKAMPKQKAMSWKVRDSFPGAGESFNS